MLRLEIETDFTKNFRRDSPVVRSYAFIERHLGGAGVWDVLLPAPANLDHEYLDRVRELEQALRDITLRDGEGREVAGLTKVLSLVDGIDATAVHPLWTRIPPELQVRGMAAMPHFVATLRTAEEPGATNYLRVMLRRASSNRLPTSRC